jgi:NAD(P)-dependent dehydrogenase (short-subunit alcohol dehydrogenase family)
MNPPITSWRGKRVWIIGASTGIGAALLTPLFAAGAKVAMSARREQPLRQAADEAWRALGGANSGTSTDPSAHAAAGAAIDSHAPLAAAGHLLLAVDVTRRDDIQRAHDQLIADWGGIDLVLWVAGTYYPMRADTYDHDKALSIINTNLIGVLNGLSVLLPTLIAQKHGGIAIVSSVAGYSGLPKALIYGPSKAALINLCESLYLDLHPLGIGVTLINPGFVATPLTAGNDFHMPALISADQAARAILRGLEAGRFEIHRLYMFLMSRVAM